MSKYFSRLAHRTGLDKPQAHSQRISQATSSPLNTALMEEVITVEAPQINFQPMKAPVDSFISQPTPKESIPIKTKYYDLGIEQPQSLKSDITPKPDITSKDERKEEVAKTESKEKKTKSLKTTQETPLVVDQLIETSSSSKRENDSEIRVDRGDKPEQVPLTGLHEIFNGLEKNLEKQVDQEEVSPQKGRSARRKMKTVEKDIQTYIRSNSTDASGIEESKAEYISLPAPISEGKQRESNTSLTNIDVHIGKVIVDVRQETSTVAARPQPQLASQPGRENTSFQRGKLNRHYLRGY